MLQIIDIATGVPRALTSLESAAVLTELGAVTSTAFSTLSTNVALHTSNTGNPHQVTAGQVNLGNVDNTRDADKALSTAAIQALAGKAPSSHTHTTAQVTGLDTTLTAQSTQIAQNTQALQGHISYAATQPDASAYVWWQPSAGVLWKSDGTTWTQVTI